MNNFRFPKSGKVMVGLELTDHDMDDLVAYAKLKSGPYQKTFLKADGKLDNYREMCTVKVDSQSLLCLQNLKKTVQEGAQLFDPSWIVGKIQLLHSFAGGAAQEEHTYTTHGEQIQPKNGHSFASCIVAIQKGTKLMSNGEQLKILKGCALIFQDDFVHGGAAYEEDNYRFYVNLTFQGIDTTIKNVQPVKTCKHCKRSFAKDNTYWGHTRMCKLNPSSKRIRDKKNAKAREKYAIKRSKQ